MTYILTSDWDAIQERNIDPHSPVTSDNHNKLLKTFGEHKMWVEGLDISFQIDTTENKLIGTVDIGCAFVQYMAVEFKSAATIEICQAPVTERDLYVVLEYTYRNVQPVPMAYIKVIRSENYNSSNQLRLYRIHIGNWSAVPPMTEITSWFESGNLVDMRNDIENTPSWANVTYLRLDGENEVEGFITLRNLPVNNTDATNKAYVDGRMSGHSDLHNDYFVRKNPDSTSSDFGKVIENIDIKMISPYLKLTDAADSDNGLSVTATGTAVTFDNTKSKYDFKINGTSVGEINSYGVVGSVYNADIAEYFQIDPEVKEMPYQGTCMCVRDGIAVVSSCEGDPSCVGFVSYKPAYVLGGTTDFEKEFENGKVPIAIMGQLKEVCVYAHEYIPCGALIISGLDGKGFAISPESTEYSFGSVVGKSLVPVYPGENYIYILLK